MRWRGFVRWLRVHFLDCRCKRKRRISPMRHRRAMVRQLLQWARAELIDRNEKVPREPELRRLVRLALRYIRRGRTRFGVRDMLNDKIFASGYLATFITIRLEKAASEKPS